MSGNRDVSWQTGGLTGGRHQAARDPLARGLVAVIVGNSHAYKDPRIPNLRFARKDAEAVYKVLTDPAIGRFSPDNVITLLDGDATERKIRSALGTKLPRLTSKTSTVCIYYAGHGAPVIDVDAKRRSADNIEKDPRGPTMPRRTTCARPPSRWIPSNKFFVARCQAGDSASSTPVTAAAPEDVRSSATCFGLGQISSRTNIWIASPVKAGWS